MMRHSLIASCVVVCVVPALSAPALAAHHGYRHVAYRQVAYRHAMAMRADDTRHYYYDYAPAMQTRRNREDAWQQNGWQQQNGWGQSDRQQNGFGQTGFGQTGQYGALDGMASTQASANGIPVSLVQRVIKRESGGNPRAVSAGNYGLMQIRLGTARAMGFSGSAAELLDPQVNMTYAVRYLAGAYRAANGNENRAVALYASGYYTQAKAQGFSPYASQSSGFGAYAQTGFQNAEAYGTTMQVYRVRHYRRHA
jgi:soluble lytic murein transglycosylase-like protein